GEPLPLATVGIVKTSRGTASNSEGFFALPDLEDDSLEIVISYLGYKPIQMLASEFHKLEGSTIHLQPAATLLDDVTIEDQYQSAIQLMAQPGVARLDAQKINTFPNLGQPDVFQAIQLIPGISATSGGSANLQIRGGTPDQNLILFDDIPLYHLDHFYGIYSSLNPLAIQSLQVYKGGFPAKYDGRSNAVVDIKSRGGNRNEIDVEANLNLLSANLAVDVPIGNKLVWTAAGRIAYDDILATPLYWNLTNAYRQNRLDNSAEWVSWNAFPELSWEPDFDFYDANSKLTYYPSEKDVISANLFFSNDKLNINLNQFEYWEDINFGYEYFYNQASDWNNDGLSLSWARQWNEHWYTKALMSFSEYENTTTNFSYYWEGALDDEESEGEVDQHEFWTNRIRDGQFKIIAGYQPNSRHHLDFGATLNGMSTQFSRKKYDVELYPDTLFRNFSTEGGRYSWYIQDTWTPGDGTKIIFGLRRNRYTPQDTAQLFWAPRLSVEQRVGKRLMFRTAAGFYQQFVQQITPDRFNTTNQFLWLMGDNLQIPIQRSFHTLVGLQWANDNGWMIDWEGYFRRTTGITELFLYDDVLSEETGLDDLQARTGIARAVGMDFTIHKDEGNYRGWFNYSLGGVRNRIEGVNRGRLYPATQDQRHELNLVQMYKMGKWDISATVVYGSGRP
ncbi:MAG TPA: hypothetical protein DCE41_33290, partial [Cytophagales bacterium]|nr:hypothetical protein [Cytophagales bacterium]